MAIYFRPHHFLCTFCFQGKGYSPSFVDNYAQIVAQLQQDDQTPITVVERTDSICAACPHQSGALCAAETKVQRLDQAHAAVLGIKTGDILTWRQAQHRIAQNINLPTFHTICATCQWQSLGICEQTLTILAGDDL